MYLFLYSAHKYPEISTRWTVLQNTNYLECFNIIQKAGKVIYPCKFFTYYLIFLNHSSEYRYVARTTFYFYYYYFFFTEYTDILHIEDLCSGFGGD